MSETSALAVPEDVSSGGRPRRSRGDVVRMVLVSLGFAAGIMLIAWGLMSSVTGREALGLPDEIETLSPSPNDTQVLERTEVFVDLVPGYEAELTIDGIILDTVRLGEIAAQPGQQVELPPVAVYDPGNYSIRFQPQDGAPIESWSPGTHVVTVRYWKVEDSREATEEGYTWSFQAL